MDNRNAGNARSTDSPQVNQSRRFLCVLDSAIVPDDRWLWNYLPDRNDQVDFSVAHSPDLFGGVGKALTRYPGYIFNAERALQSAKHGNYDAIVAWESKNGLPLAFFRWLHHDSRTPLLVLTFSAKQYVLRLNAVAGRWLRQAVHLTVPSEWEAIHYRKIFDLPGRQVSVCHLGAYDRREQLPPVSTWPDARQRDQYVFSGGRTDRDYPTLFGAVAGTGVRTIVNTRPYIVRGLRVPGEVEINDLMSGAEYAALVAQANAVIVPLRMVNHAAGLSLVLDAMSLGRPVICSDIPTVRDYIVDGVTGILVPPGNAAALRAAITALRLDVSRSEEMGRAARARYEEKFTFSAFAQRAYDILAGVVATAKL